MNTLYNKTDNYMNKRDYVYIDENSNSNNAANMNNDINMIHLNSDNMSSVSGRQSMFGKKKPRVIWLLKYQF